MNNINAWSTWSIFGVLVQLQTKYDRPNKSHHHNRHLCFQSQQKTKKKTTRRYNYAPLLHTIGPTMWKTSWWYGSGRRNSEFSLSVLTCSVCLLVVDNTSDFQATIIPLYQVVELQKRLLLLFWLWWMYWVTYCSHCKSIYIQTKSIDSNTVTQVLTWHSSCDHWLYRLLLIFGLGGKSVLSL